MRANRCEQRPLAFLAFRADLREPRGDHADRPNPRIEDGLDRLEDCGRRKTDDGEIYGVGDVSDGAVSPNACDRLAVAIHGVCGTHVLALEDVAEELASDRAPARRGAEHRDGLRLEERTERRDDRSVITFLDERCITDGGSDRERHLDLAAAESSRHFEAHAFEDLDHRGVVRHHFADETFDSVSWRRARRAARPVASRCRVPGRHPQRRKPPPRSADREDERSWRARRLAPHPIRPLIP